MTVYDYCRQRSAKSRDIGKYRFKPRCRPVVKILPDGKRVHYDSITEAALCSGVTDSSLIRQIRGKMKSDPMELWGFRFEYAEESHE